MNPLFPHQQGSLVCFVSVKQQVKEKEKSELRPAVLAYSGIAPCYWCHITQYNLSHITWGGDRFPQWLCHSLKDITEGKYVDWHSDNVKSLRNLRIKSQYWSPLNSVSNKHTLIMDSPGICKGKLVKESSTLVSSLFRIIAAFRRR